MRHDDGTMSGYIGTAQYRRDRQAERAMRNEARAEALRQTARAMGEGVFDTCPAPCIPAVQHVVAIGEHGPCNRKQTRTFEPRFITRREHIEYVRRAAIQARLDTTRGDDVPAFEPLAWLRDDVANGSFPRADDTVHETVSYPQHLNPSPGKRVATITARLSASGRMVQLERLHRDYRRVAQGWDALIRASTSGDGRGTIQQASRIPGAVNGTEVRFTPRWQASKRRLITTTDEAGNAVPVDWRCYRVLADGTRVPLVSTATAKQRKRKATTTTTERKAALMAAATTAGHVDSMLS